MNKISNFLHATVAGLSKAVLLALFVQLSCHAPRAHAQINPGPVQAGTGLSKSGSTLSVKYGSTAGTAAQGNDSRFSNPAASPSTLTAHGVLIGNGSSAINATSAGTSGQCLISNGASADPTFQACSAGGSGTVNSGTAGQLTYYGATGNTVSGNADATISSGSLTLGVANTTLGNLLLNGGTSGTVTIQPQAAAGTYNFNLPTSAGSSGQPLLSGGGVSSPMTFGTLGVAAGGTGATTLTANNVILGNGTSAVQFVAPGTSGNVLTSNGTTWQSTAPTGAAPTLISATVDTTYTSTTTMADVTGLSGTLTTGHTYWVEIDLIVASTAGSTPQFKYQLTGTATGSYLNFKSISWPDSNTGQLCAFTALTTACDGGTGSGSFTNDVIIRLTGYINCNGTGTLKVQGAQHTSSATSVLVKQGSTMRIYQVT